MYTVLPHWLGLTINGNIGGGLSHVRLKTWPIVWVLSLSPSPNQCGLVPHVWSIAVLLHSSSTPTSCPTGQLMSVGHPTKTTKTAWKTSSAFQLSVKAESWCIMDEWMMNSIWKIGTFQPPICNHHSTRHVPYTILSACVCVCPVHHSSNKSSGIRKL